MKYQGGRLAAESNHQAGSSGGTDRMEAELTRWFTGLEPAGTPIAVRLRTFADLREEAARPRPRLPWLRPALSSMASLGSVVAGAGVILLLALVGASLDHGGRAAGSFGAAMPAIDTGSPSPGVYYSYSPDPLPLLALLLFSALAGCTILIPAVRRIAGGIVQMGGATAPSAPLSLRRSWRSRRSVSPIAWILLAVAVVITVWGCRNCITANYDSYTSIIAVNGLVTSGLALFLPFVVAWRYSLADRSARLLLLGAFAAVAELLFQVALFLLGLYPSFGEPIMTIWESVPVLGAVALAAGLAGRAGAVRRPPLRLVAAAVGVAFSSVTMYGFMYGIGNPVNQFGLETMFGFLTSWIRLVAWLAIVWIGWSAWRRNPGSMAWKLVLAAGALHLLALVPNYLMQVYAYLDPEASMTTPFDMSFTMTDGTITFISPNFWVDAIAGRLSEVALLVALLIGLRPARPSAQPDDDPPVAEAPDYESRAVEASGGPSRQAEPAGTTTSAASTAESAAT